MKRLLADAGIVRHRGKIEAVINNARRAREMVEHAGSLAAYFWRYEAAGADRGRRGNLSTSDEAIALSRDLKKLGWKFVGPDHRVRLHAGHGTGQRSRRGLRDSRQGGARRKAFKPRADACWRQPLNPLATM